MFVLLDTQALAGFAWVVPVRGSSVATANSSSTRAALERPSPGEWGHRSPGRLLYAIAAVT